MTRHIVASLDVESRWLRGPTRSNQPSNALPHPLRRRLSLLGTLLRVFAQDGDTLWSLEPVDVNSMPDLPGIARIHTKAGEPPRHDDATLDWSCGAIGVAPTIHSKPDAIAEAIWQPTAMTTDERIHANRRTTLSELGLNESMALRTIGDVDLDHDVWHAPWVVKGDLSVAGRDRLRGADRRDASRLHQRIEKLVQRHGGAVVEPWRNQIQDVALVGMTTHRNGMHPTWIHRHASSSAGGIESIITSDDPSMLVGTEIQSAMRVCAEQVVSQLDLLGPYGVDGYVHGRDQGDPQLVPISEVNARMTMGIVAHAWRERVAEALWGPGPHIVRLGFGARTSNDATTTCLVRDTESGESIAWLERVLPNDVAPLTL